MVEGGVREAASPAHCVAHWVQQVVAAVMQLLALVVVMELVVRVVLEILETLRLFLR